MKFRVTRTSNLDDRNDPNVPGAVPAEFTRIDRWEYASPEAMEPHRREQWFSCGTNHRVENGEVVRDGPVFTRWVIEVPSLEALLQIVADAEFEELWTHQVIVTQARGNMRPDLPEIEIYDDYCE